LAALTQIFGARRLEPCSLILRWETIPCVMLDLESILVGEYVENEFRKQFTKSERKAIGEAVEQELHKKERRGNPQLGKKLPNSQTQQLKDERGFMRPSIPPRTSSTKSCCGCCSTPPSV
jgi:hypothetical protein